MNRTETAIIDAFWQLLEEKPYNKITVKNIVDQCQLNRNTFYYHFQDIPELLDRIMKNEADIIIKQHHQFESPLDCITPVVQLSKTRKKAILNIYHSVERDVFLNQLEALILYFVDKFIEINTENIVISLQDKKLLIRFYKCALVGITLDWLDKEMNYDIIDDFIRIFHLFAGTNGKALIRSTIIKS